MNVGNPKQQNTHFSGEGKWHLILQNPQPLGAPFWLIKCLGGKGPKREPCPLSSHKKALRWMCTSITDS